MDDYDYYIQGNYCYKRGEYLLAIEYFLASNNINPHFKTYERLYDCYYNVGEKDKALENIKKSYDFNSKNDKVAVEYAKLLIDHKKDFILAKKILKDTIQRNPSFKQAKSLINSIVE